jgi:hypothetical protein
MSNVQDRPETERDQTDDDLRVDHSRRSLALTLFGTLGAGALLHGCASEAGARPEADGVGGDPELSGRSQALDGTTNIRWFDTVASMRAFTVAPSTNYTALVHGYAAPGDGGGGMFVWSTTAAQDDGKPATALHSGTIINPLVSGVINTSPAAGWRRVFSGPIDVRWFGARGDGSTNDTDAIAAALSAAGSRGRLLISQGTYLVSGSSSEIFLVGNAIEIEGTGRGSIIMVGSSTGASTDIFRITPANSGYNDGRMIKLSGFSIFPQSGTPGRHGIAIDVDSATEVAAMLQLDRLSIGALGGRGVASISHTDGFFDSSITNCVIANGILLDYGGDNLYVEHCITTGANYGLEVTLVTGSSALVVRQNAFVGAGGVLLHRARAAVICENQFEPQQTIATIGGRKSLICIQGDVERIDSAKIHNNTFNVAPSVSDTAIYVDNGYGADVESNVFTPGTASAQFLYTTSAANNTRIGQNTSAYDGVSSVINLYEYNTSTETLQFFTDFGEATSGIRKAVSLQNSWVEYLSNTAPSHWMDKDGWVHLFGVAKNGLHAPTTLLFTLPAGHTPMHLLRIPTYANGSTSGHVTAYIEIATNGQVTLVQDPDASGTILQLQFTGISFPSAWVAP